MLWLIYEFLVILVDLTNLWTCHTKRDDQVGELERPTALLNPCRDFRTNIELGNVTPHNIKQLKRLNSVVFPVSYNDKFYKDVLEAGELAKLAYYNDIVVGAVCCRIDTSEKSRRLYIMTLGCLYPYRRLGIGTLMVQHVLNYVEQEGNFDSIFL